MVTAEPEMTAEHHEEQAHRLLTLDHRQDGLPEPEEAAARAQAHATLAVALRLGPTTEERRAAIRQRQADEEAQAVVLLISRAETPEAKAEVEGEWPEAIDAALDRGWLIWLHEAPGIPKALVVTSGGRALLERTAGS